LKKPSRAESTTDERSDHQYPAEVDADADPSESILAFAEPLKANKLKIW